MGAGASTEQVDEAAVTKGQAIIRGKQSRKQMAEKKEEQARAAADAGAAAATTAEDAPAPAATAEEQEQAAPAEEKPVALDVALISLAVNATGSEFVLVASNAADSSVAFSKALPASVLGGDASLLDMFVPSSTAELEPLVAELAGAVAAASEVVFMADIATLAGQALLALVLPSFIRGGGSKEKIVCYVALPTSASPAMYAARPFDAYVGSHALDVAATCFGKELDCLPFVAVTPKLFHEKKPCGSFAEAGYVHGKQCCVGAEPADFGLLHSMFTEMWKKRAIAHAVYGAAEPTEALDADKDLSAVGTKAFSFAAAVLKVIMPFPERTAEELEALKKIAPDWTKESDEEFKEWCGYGAPPLPANGNFEKLEGLKLKDDPSGVATAMAQRANAFPSKMSDPVLVAAFGDEAEKMASSLKGNDRVRMAPADISAEYFGDEKNKAFSFFLVLLDHKALCVEASNGDCSKVKAFEKLMMTVCEAVPDKHRVALQMNAAGIENGKERWVVCVAWGVGGEQNDRGGKM